MLQYRLDIPITIALFLCTAFARAEDQYEQPPISYSATEPRNVVSALKADLASGAVHLARDQQHGYLPALLDHLKVPRESQVLVFSKTSLQRELISPTNPRAIYFNDDIYIGTVPGSNLIEVSVADPDLGAVFYTFAQHIEQPPELARQTSTCLQCHSGTMTNDLPGHMVRSVYTDEKGFPILKAGTHLTTHDSDFDERWGGWYVTGTHGAARHMGNVFAIESNTGATLDVEAGANRGELDARVNRQNYLMPHSDIVALMVMEHQTEAHNLMTAAAFDTRMALRDQAVMDEVLQRPKGQLSDSTQRRIANAGKKLVDYMLFAEEARLTAPVSGTAGFAEHFSTQGPRDSKGRSLRDLDLQTRLFKYPLSYLVYSAQFDGLPQEMKDYVYRRLWDILTAATKPERGQAPTPEQCTAIIEILRDTKHDLPDYWAS